MAARSATGTADQPKSSVCSQAFHASDACGCVTRISAPDPEREFGRICNLVGLDPLPGPYDFLSGDHHIIGNHMRLSSSGEVVLDERWRSILSGDEADAVRRKTADYREKFSYT